MQFEDDLAAGTVLVRPALQSPDYVAGTSGWQVAIDGSAEFNDVVIRGTLQSTNYVAGSAGWKLDQAGAAEFNNVTIRGATSVGGKSLYYSGTPAAGNLLLSIAATAGTDSFGNTYGAGLGVYDPANGTVKVTGGQVTVSGTNGSAVQLDTGASGNAGQANVYLTPRSLGGTTWQAAELYTTLGASNRPGVGILAPSKAGAAGNLPSIELYGPGPTTTDDYILVGATRVSFSGLVSMGCRYETIVTITPSAANTPTSVNITYPNLGGTQFVGQATPETAVPGTQVTGVGLSNVTATGATVWLTRTNTTSTKVHVVISSS